MVDKENIYAVSIYCGQNRIADFLYVGQQIICNYVCRWYAYPTCAGHLQCEYWHVIRFVCVR